MKRNIQKRIFILAQIIMAVAFNSFIGVAAALVTGMPVMACVAVSNGIGLIAPVANLVKYVFTGTTYTHLAGGIALDGLNKEIWIDRLILNVYEDAEFLADAIDMNDEVEKGDSYDKINFAMEGQKPNVEINRRVFPIPIAAREDMPLSVELDDYSTDTTLVQDFETAELNYNKMDSVLRSHKNTLVETFGWKSMHNWGATQHTTKTPVLEFTGADNGSGLCIPKRSDFSKLARACDIAGIPKKGRVIYLDSNMWWDFVDNDTILAAQYANTSREGVISGVLTNIYGIDVKMQFTTPLYRKVGGIWVKQAFGAERTADDFSGAVMVVKQVSCMKAIGTMKMFAEMNRTDYQGNTVNFLMRALSTPLTQLNLGVIVQKPYA